MTFYKAHIALGPQFPPRNTVLTDSHVPALQGGPLIKAFPLLLGRSLEKVRRAAGDGGREGCSLSNALGQGGLAAEAWALL